MHRYLMIIFLILHLFNPLRTDDWCDTAPDEGRREICLQIHEMDKRARDNELATALSLKRKFDADPVTIYDCRNISCVCTFLKGNFKSNKCVLTNGKLFSNALRKEYRTLSDNERKRFHEAMWTIKRSGVFDDFARLHSRFASSSGAHSGPAFLPWHREYLKRVELALRFVDPSVAIPYWDSVLDHHLPSPKDSALWSDELLGGAIPGEVKDGAFKGWMLENGTRVIRRNVGHRAAPMSENNVEAALNMSTIEEILAYTASGSTRKSRELDYPQNITHCSSAAHFSSALMRPFDPLLNMDGLSNAYTDLFYSYSPRVTCSLANRDCGSNRWSLICSMCLLMNDFDLGIFFVTSLMANRDVRLKLLLAATAQDSEKERSVATKASVKMANACLSLYVGGRLFLSYATCFNDNECCGIWAEFGHCESNPSFMLSWCKASCNVCTPNYNITLECTDRYSLCSDLTDDCHGRRAWMKENCRKSCGFCNKTREQDCTGTDFFYTIMFCLGSGACKEHYYFVGIVEGELAWTSISAALYGLVRAYVQMIGLYLTWSKHVQHHVTDVDNLNSLFSGMPQAVLTSIHSAKPGHLPTYASSEKNLCGKIANGRAEVPTIFIRMCDLANLNNRVAACRFERPTAVEESPRSLDAAQLFLRQFYQSIEKPLSRDCTNY
ncbi:shTK domain protein [Ancylostoma caninum]|uniref:ShTK domain protein n=1 Tax=Ancylostoma caninum TaxID=29170 RepID=A0A368H8E6_ANCCA|nr:shTK domain protein [Ancylostoma caninum]